MRRRRESGEKVQLGWMGLVLVHQSAGEKRSRGSRHLDQVHIPFYLSFKFNCIELNIYVE
jgi:hypothetical protein